MRSILPGHCLSCSPTAAWSPRKSSKNLRRSLCFQVRLPRLPPEHITQICSDIKTVSLSIWAGPVSTPAWSSAANASPAPRVLSTATGSLYRRWISPPSARAAAVSAGSTKAACCRWARKAPGHCRGRSVTIWGENSRPAPMPTWFWATLVRTISPAEKSS